jgi:hypothetical protein
MYSFYLFLLLLIDNDEIGPPELVNDTGTQTRGGTVPMGTKVRVRVTLL